VVLELVGGITFSFTKSVVALTERTEPFLLRMVIALICHLYTPQKGKGNLWLDIKARL
jgi:hypothetical protein